ncbi:hypothetical protein [Micromonospora peucetia]|uniref:Uncharacterized protein n=1 Tax=Micromonospora peucetia TaxID=47871 RepID=A0ABZ1EJY6_9ACTN|nr:hypothetical protein [Micromonospora peucetia]WSA34545.1 hypothetical protein OIE14_11125 [Micromonospora peucetia]
MAEKTIKHASFWYTDGDGLHRVASRGEKVDITSDADLKRGEQHGAFASKEDLAEGSPLAAFIASREASASPASVTLDPSEVEARTSPAGSSDPAIQSGMVAPTGSDRSGDGSSSTRRSGRKSEG